MRSFPRFTHLAFSALIILLIGALAACGSTTTQTTPTATSGPPVTLNVFAAASLTDAFNQIGKQFTQAHPNVTVQYNFAGSQQLAQQITQGADVDVFASANQKQMDVTVTGGQVDKGSSKIFVRNLLTVIFPKANPGKISTLQDLAKPGLKIVLAAAAVPAGQYAVDFLDRASKDASYTPDYKANVLKNVVSYEDNVKSVLTKVSLGEADAGIVYVTDELTSASTLGQVAIPANLQTVAAYPIAPIKSSKQAAVAQQFVDYVLSSDGQKVLASFGFMPPV
jgi:molybdate transport system substrate-binding protein